jgi:hypothetical protein
MVTWYTDVRETKRLILEFHRNKRRRLYVTGMSICMLGVTAGFRTTLSRLGAGSLQRGQHTEVDFRFGIGRETILSNFRHGHVPITPHFSP